MGCVFILTVVVLLAVADVAIVRMFQRQRRSGMVGRLVRRLARGRGAWGVG